MKAGLLEQIRVELRGRLQRLAQSALEAHAAATDPGSKAEGKYDTRSLEASYLAAGQSRQVDELAEAVRIFEAFSPPDFTMDDSIGMGALVETDMGGETSLLLLVPAAGGMVLSMDGQEVTLLSPASSLYQNLLGKKAGDFLEEYDMLVIEVS
jgi:transcription elongation GreA/GreB family factor